MIFFSHTYGIRFFYSDERLRGMWFLFEYQLRSISSTDCIVPVIFYYFHHIANIYIDDVLWWYRIASDNCLKFIRWFISGGEKIIVSIVFFTFLHSMYKYNNLSLNFNSIN